MWISSFLLIDKRTGKEVYARYVTVSKTIFVLSVDLTLVWLDGWSYGLMDGMDLHAIRIEVPSDGNIIVGQSHFIKTVEDIYEAIVNTVPQMKFGIAFNEASGACLTRVDGNDEELQTLAARNATAVGAGHLFVVALRGGFPINVKNRILETPEVCTIFCATANPLEVIVAQTEQGRGVLGVIDGSSPKGVETATDTEWRHGFLRKIGYKK